MLYMEKTKEKWCAALAVFVCGFMAHGYFLQIKSAIMTTAVIISE